MVTYIVRRLLQGILVLFGISFVSFGAMFLAGDPTSLMINETWTQDQIDEFRHRMGFDRPWPVQYVDFLSNAVRGDFGTSLRTSEPAFNLVIERMPATLQLTAAAMLFATVGAIPLGIISAVKRNTLPDYLSMSFAILGQAIPLFWLGILMIQLFGLQLRWFPISGRGTIKHLVMPAIALGTFSLAANARLIRSSLLEALGQAYVVTARSKGLAERVVVVRHAFRNALIPVVIIVGLQLGSLLGGAIITETIFAWPGVGRLTVHSIYNRDFPVVQAAVTLLAAIFVVTNIGVDIICAYLDPRIRLEAD
jgi:ABC-type dipeptide/oligopeptide/nickel transport system permease component